MLSSKVEKMCKDKGWWYQDITQEYSDALLALQIDLSSDFAQFYLHSEDGATFYSKSREIYHICWFILHSNYTLDLERTHDVLKLPSEYIPLDAFNGGSGYFYNRKTCEVLDIGLGIELKEFLHGDIHPQWKDFNSFLECFFEL